MSRIEPSRPEPVHRPSVERDLETLSALLARLGRERTRTPSTRGVASWGMKRFWKTVGDAAVGRSLCAPDERDPQMLADLRAVGGTRIPKTALLLSWDTYSYYFVDAADPSDDPVVWTMNDSMGEPADAYAPHRDRGFLAFATAMAVGHALESWRAEMKDGELPGEPLLPSLEPDIRESKLRFYTRFDPFGWDDGDERLMEFRPPRRRSRLSRRR